MKTITIFAEKGGMGKTTLSAMFASWLAYKKRERVLVYDFDYPKHQFMGFRENDLEVLSRDARYAQMCEGNTPFRMGTVNTSTMMTPQQLRSLADNVRAASAGDGYCIFDFPGRFLPQDVARHFVFSGMLDLIVLLVDSDRQSQESALYINGVIRSEECRSSSGKDSQAVVALWNKEASAERQGARDWYSGPEKLFSAVGLETCATRMRDILAARRDAGTFGFVRNTLCWPESNIQSRCPYVEDIFEELKERLDRAE